MKAINQCHKELDFVLDVVGISVMSFIYVRENVPSKQNENMRRISMPVFQEKRNSSLKQRKVSMWVLFYESGQTALAEVCI